MRIELLDEQTAPEADLRAAYEVARANELELTPDWEPDSWEDFLAQARHPLSWRRTTRWVARTDDDTIVGTVVLICAYLSTNRHEAELWLDVAPMARRRGVGRSLLRAAAEHALADGRTLLDSGCREHGTGPAFAEAVGMVAKLRERRSGLRLDGLDRGLLEKWAAPVPGYELVSWEGPTPAEWVERMARAEAVMNTAPLEDFEMEPTVLTPDELVERDTARVAQGTTMWTVAAVDAVTNEVAGYTEIGFVQGRSTVSQGNTGVWPEHRNHGLGRLLKAEMLLRLLDRRPDVSAVETWNAGSNEPMLKINVELGFEVVDWWWNLQGSTTDVLKRTTGP
ncbi:MAG TPA: GNAT family N-acetyltransferase [Acidimicrobiales bacterium]|nr:GNAT family N-acetyltransferase [Acidimicrobiales bacterium]